MEAGDERTYMKTLLLAVVVMGSSFLRADEIFRIEVGRDYHRYTQTDLQKRVWELERAVWQLQQRVFQLEATKTILAPAADPWVCTIQAMGEPHTGTGATKALASAAAVKACKDARDGDAFFCKNPKCEQ